MTVRPDPDRGWLSLATLWGLGRNVPAAPGTFGSAVAAVAAWPLVAGFGSWTLVALTLVLIPLGVEASGRASRRSGGRDPGAVVIDEVAGQWVALWFVTPSWWSWLLAFGLFRLFDIWKPFPVRRLESLPGGRGIVADDLMAGAYALVLHHVLLRWILIQWPAT